MQQSFGGEWKVAFSWYAVHVSGGTNSDTNTRTAPPATVPRLPLRLAVHGLCDRTPHLTSLQSVCTHDLPANRLSMILIPSWVFFSFFKFLVI